MCGAEPIHYKVRDKMFMTSAKTLSLCVVIVLFSSNATKSEEIFGGMGCEIMNLKMLSMLDGEIK